MIIGAWGQHPTLRHSQDPIFSSLRRWSKTQVPTKSLPVSTAIASMDQTGVDKMLISAWVAPRNVMIFNDEVAANVNEASERLIGVGWVDISKPMEAVREIRRCIDELGFRAIRVLPWLWEVPPIYLDQVALYSPELKIVGGHIGYPWTEEAIALVPKHENVYIDTSAYTVKRYPEALVKFLRSHSTHKVLFGTNYPMMPHAKALSGLETLELNEDVRAGFLGRNAKRVFSL